jgi:hypothetical protein
MIGADEELTGYGYWHHWAFTVFTASPEELTRADEVAQRIANEHGVTYKAGRFSDRSQTVLHHHASPTDDPRIHADVRVDVMRTPGWAFN